MSEGFGLLPLEAMACGAPVIAADTTPLLEVVGRCDMLVDPADPVALATAIGRVLNDPDRRADLSEYGLERAKRFSWEGVGPHRQRLSSGSVLFVAPPFTGCPVAR